MQFLLAEINYNVLIFIIEIRARTSMSTSYLNSIYVRLALAEDEVKRIRLMHMKWIASGLLLAVALLYILATASLGKHSVWPYIRAFAEAAMVGAIADWFAVEALFRHPFGVQSIPHTAIIPKNKDRIADNLGDFVQGEFFSTERITTAIRNFNPALQFAAFISRSQNSEKIGAIAVKMIAYGIAALDQSEVRNFLRTNFKIRFNQLDLSMFGGKILRSLTKDGRHQAILDQALKLGAEYLHQKKNKENIIEFAANKIPLGMDALKTGAARILVEKTLDIVTETLDAMDRDSNHPLRARFNDAVTHLVFKLESDPSFRARIKAHQEQLAGNEVITSYIDDLFADLCTWITTDIGHKNSVIGETVSNMIGTLGAALTADKAIQEWINAEILHYVPTMLDEYRPKIGQLISSKMKEWKEHEIVDKLELNIGRDLQFIRLNGTIVGGVVGLMIHVLTVALM